MESSAPIAETTTTITAMASVAPELDPEFIEAADRYEASTKIRRFYSYDKPESLSPAHQKEYMIQKEIADRYGKRVIEKFIDDRAVKQKMKVTAERLQYLEEVEDPPTYREGPRKAFVIFLESKKRIDDIGADLDDCVGMAIYSKPYMLQYEYHKRKHARLIAINGHYLFLKAKKGGDLDRLYQEFIQTCGGNEASQRNGSLTESEVEARYTFITRDLKSLSRLKSDIDRYTHLIATNPSPYYQKLLDDALPKYEALYAVWSEILTHHGPELFTDLWDYY